MDMHLRELATRLTPMPNRSPGATLLIGLDGGHVLAGFKGGAGIMEEVAPASSSPGASVLANRWKTGMAAERVAYLRRWFSTDGGRPHARAMDAVARLLACGAVHRVIASDANGVLFNELSRRLAAVSGRLEHIEDLPDRNADSLRCRLQMSKSVPNLVDARELLIGHIFQIATRDNPETVEDALELLKVLRETTDQQLVICWGWSKYNRVLGDLFENNPRLQVFLLGEESQEYDSIILRTGNLQVVSRSNIEAREAAALPSAELLVELADLVCGPGSADGEQEPPDGVPVPPATPLLSPPRPASWLLWRASMNRILEQRKENDRLHLVATDGQEVRRRLADAIETSIQQSGVWPRRLMVDTLADLWVHRQLKPHWETPRPCIVEFAASGSWARVEPDHGHAALAGFAAAVSGPLPYCYILLPLDAFRAWCEGRPVRSVAMTTLPAEDCLSGAAFEFVVQSLPPDTVGYRAAEARGVRDLAEEMAGVARERMAGSPGRYIDHVHFALDAWMDRASGRNEEEWPGEEAVRLWTEILVAVDETPPRDEIPGVPGRRRGAPLPLPEFKMRRVSTSFDLGLRPSGDTPPPPSP